VKGHSPREPALNSKGPENSRAKSLAEAQIFSLAFPLGPDENQPGPLREVEASARRSQREEKPARGKQARKDRAGAT